MGFSAVNQINRQAILNDGFWPDLNTGDFADASRLDGTVATPRLIAALTDAISMVNREQALRLLKQQKIEQGFSSLAAVPASQINGESEAVMLYRKAVYNEARALLTEHYRDFDTTTDGDKRAKTLDPQIDAYRRDVRRAIADLTEQPYSVIELI